MSNPFDEQLPEPLTCDVEHQGVIETLQLVMDGGDVYFKFTFRPDSQDFESFRTTLRFKKDGARHAMAASTAKYVAELIGGRSAPNLATASGDNSPDAISAACDLAIQTPVVLKLKANKDPQYPPNIAFVKRA